MLLTCPLRVPGRTLGTGGQPCLAQPPSKSLCRLSRASEDSPLQRKPAGDTCHPKHQRGLWTPPPSSMLDSEDLELPEASPVSPAASRAQLTSCRFLRHRRCGRLPGHSTPSNPALTSVSTRRPVPIGTGGWTARLPGLLGPAHPFSRRPPHSMWQEGCCQNGPAAAFFMTVGATFFVVLLCESCHQPQSSVLTLACQSAHSVWVVSRVRGVPVPCFCRRFCLLR